MRWLRLTLFVALCGALAVQGVAQARALAAPCLGHATGHTAPHGPATHAVPADAVMVAGAFSTHDCCDDDATLADHSCKMGGDCQAHAFVPLLSTPVAVHAMSAVSSPMTPAAQVLDSGLRNRVWRPPAFA